jgi:hypothetical protein
LFAWQCTNCGYYFQQEQKVSLARWRGARMAKYGLFYAAGQAPLQQYEGDQMVQQREYVMIYKTPNETEPRRLVVAIRLEKNQSVREI